MAEEESKTIPINEEVLDEYHNLIDQCYASCIATSETFEMLGHICCLAATIDDFKLAHEIYKFANSSWFVACLMQVVNEGCAAHYVEQEHGSEFDEQFFSVARFSVNLALGYVETFTYNEQFCSFDEGPKAMHTYLVHNATECQVAIKSIVKKFDAVNQLISEMVSACRSDQAVTEDTLVVCSQMMKISKHQWQIQLELIDRLLKLLSLESVDRERTACIAVEIYLLLKFNLNSNYEHMDIRLAVLDMVSITDVQVQKEKVVEVKDKCEKFKQTVKARTEECKENARENLKQFLTMTREDYYR